MKPKAYQQQASKPTTTGIERRASYEAERLELKVARIMNNNEPIGDTTPLIYTERKDGVLPAYDIKTDRFDMAIEALDKGSKAYRAQREERHNPKQVEDKKEEGKTEPQQVEKVSPEAKKP